nr:unnamed protein product [Callosobruchus analis]
MRGAEMQGSALSNICLDFNVRNSSICYQESRNARMCIGEFVFRFRCPKQLDLLSGKQKREEVHGPICLLASILETVPFATKRAEMRGGAWANLSIGFNIRNSSMLPGEQKHEAVHRSICLLISMSETARFTTKRAEMRGAGLFVSVGGSVFKLKIEEKSMIFKKFKAFIARTEQNIYLKGCSQPHTPRHSRCRKEDAKGRSDSYRYEYVVQNAFLDLLEIKRSRLRCKVQTISIVLKDLRGRHESRPHRICSERFPARESHYSRTQNKLRKYLDPNLSVAELHRRFLEQNLNNTQNQIQYQLWISQTRYLTCTKILVSLQEANLNANQDKLRELKVQHELHLRKANNKCERRILFAAAWIHNLGIKNLATSETTMYMYTEHFAQKGPNEGIPCLDDFISQNKTLITKF